MKPTTLKVDRWMRWQGWIALASALLTPSRAFAHERFIKHDLLNPPQCLFFHRLDPNMVNIALRVTLVMALLLFIWFLRDPLTHAIERRFRGRLTQPIHLLVAFLTDKLVEAPWFTAVGRWIVPLVLRAPALVLMYSATSNSLVMPSFPLSPAISTLFKYVQVLMAVAIITQTFLPFVGATVLGTVLYLLYAFDWKITADVLPIVPTAAIYVSAPWASHKTAITDLSKEQMRWVRVLLGFAFFALGWMKLYNHDLTIGVADNYPHAMEDPTVRLFYVGTDPAYKREAWSTAFGLTEVLTGFLLMVGVLSRLWSVLMLYVFTKLMLVDFGWAEIPHLYPISVFLAIAFSNRLSNEFSRIDEITAQSMGGAGTRRAILVALVASVTIAFVVIFPMLYLLTKVGHP